VNREILQHCIRHSVAKPEKKIARFTDAPQGASVNQAILQHSIFLVWQHGLTAILMH
jgi:hypothetical protein